MEYRRFNSTVFIRMDPGEEVLEQLMEVCVKEKIHLAKVEALGAVSRFTVGLYDVNEKKYHSNEFVFPAEIVSLTGTVTEKEGAPYLHIHMSAADEKGHVFGGHLNQAVISATCEMTVTETERKIQRIRNDRTGLNQFKFDD